MFLLWWLKHYEKKFDARTYILTRKLLMSKIDMAIDQISWQICWITREDNYRDHFTVDSIGKLENPTQ